MRRIKDSESNGKLKSILEKYKDALREDFLNVPPPVRTVHHDIQMQERGKAIHGLLSQLSSYETRGAKEFV